MQHRLLRRCALLAAALLAAGCTQAPDLSAVRAERAKSVLRSDVFQAAASNGKLLLAGGMAGVLVRSADQGRTWSRQTLGAPSSLIAMASCPDGSFALLDFYRKVWFADADGTQWSARPLEAGFNALAISCDAANRVWVAGGNTTLLSSADRGQSWTARKLGGDAYLTTVQFVDAQHGFATGEFGIVLTTEDGGASWTKQPKIPDDFYPYAAVFVDARRGWASGLAGVIQHTEDGGKTWQRQENRTGWPLYGLVRQGERLYGIGGPQLAVLRDGAWQRLDAAQPAAASLVAGVAQDEHALLAVGAGGVLQMINTPARVAQAAPPAAQ